MNICKVFIFLLFGIENIILIKSINTTEHSKINITENSRINITENPKINITEHPKWRTIDHDTCGISNADRIIGGKNASLGMYPWIVRIGYTSSGNPLKKKEPTYRCGGTLINKLYVVTAAHCVSLLPEGFEVTAVRAGEYNTETNPDCYQNFCAESVQDFSPVSIIVHENYNKPPFKNDIAIIKLNRNVTFNAFVMPICLPSGEILDRNYTGHTAEVAGWGIYDISNPKSSTILQTIKLPIVEPDSCISAFRKHADIGIEQMCVGGVKGEDSCGGDSGGPLMKIESTIGPPKYYFIGIVSFGAKHCGKTTTPAVYSRISFYMNWILDHIEL